MEQTVALVIAWFAVGGVFAIAALTTKRIPAAK